MKRWIPFRFWPASWGLVGDAYLEAKAYYECEGEKLARRLLEIHADSNYEIQRKSLDIDLQYNRLTRYEYDIYLAKLDLEGVELEIRLLMIEVEHGRLSAYEAHVKKAELLHPPGLERELAILEVEYEAARIIKSEYEKQRATLRDEPWIAIINSGFDPQLGIDGVFFEFDWNPKWIEFLRLNGYIGHSDEQIIDDWFTDVCRSYTTAELNSAPFPKDFGTFP